MMKSVKTKIIILVCSFTIGSSLIIGIFSIFNSRKVVNADSVQIMNLLCENKVNNINNLLVAIEESVNTLTQYAQKQLSHYSNTPLNKATIQQYVDKLVDVSINAAENTLGAKTVYVRINPDLADSKSGFFYSRENENTAFEALDPTDLSLYDENDDEHVGWYYHPVHNKKATWIAPYLNKNINTEIISYVIPYYDDGEFIGVVGMDIDFDIVRKVVAETSIYETGYAFLVDERANIVYHKDVETGTDLTKYNNSLFKDLAESVQYNTSNGDHFLEYTFQGDQKEATFRTLQNNMRFILCVPKTEINAQANNLLFQIRVAMLVIVGIAIVLTFIFTKKLIRPLLELTEASKRIANGDLNVKIEHKSNDELGILAESFQQTIVHLARYFSSVKSLAYQDSLTGVKNKTAYLEEVLKIDESIQKETAQFGVIVFDINDLKAVNDHFGHNEGDLLIINSCRLICKAFHDYSVYRIGGDEFVVILQDTSEQQCLYLLEEFQKEVNLFNNSTPKGAKISIARGLAIYTLPADHDFKDVFERADRKMYNNKYDLKKKD